MRRTNNFKRRTSGWGGGSELEEVETVRMWVRCECHYRYMYLQAASED